MATILACSGCGLRLPGGTQGCRARFDQLLALEFGSVLYFGVHRLTVDTYALQHPDQYCVSAISLAAHLTGMCAAMEHGDPASVNACVQRWLSTRPVIDKPRLPVERGARTIADVRPTDDAESYARAIRSWAHATWDAYADLHPMARTWIQLAMKMGISRTR